MKGYLKQLLSRILHLGVAEVLIRADLCQDLGVADVLVSMVMSSHTAKVTLIFTNPC